MATMSLQSKTADDIDAYFATHDPSQPLDLSQLGENWKITLTLREIANLEADLLRNPESRAIQLELASVRKYLAKLQRQAAA